MQISYRWLVELTGITWSPQEVAERLTLSGLACESAVPMDRHLKSVIVGRVAELHAVEGASKLRKAIVETGKEKLTVICGAPNVAVDQKVPVALVGAKLANDLEIMATTIRGVESRGMICSEAELGISEDHSGIMVLPPEAPLGAPLADYLELNDYELGLEVTPNRGDALSAIGIARDLAALAGTQLKRPAPKIHETSDKTSDSISVRTEDPIGCPRYTARIIKNVTVGPSPWWLKRKLIACGVRPISNIVDITNLVMLETGQPLHGFDYDRFGSREVVVRRARPGEKLTTLDGKERELTPDILMITNGKRSVALAGIMGGADSEVLADTTTILLEGASFDSVVVRKGRRQLGILSEAATRFERGVDPNSVEYAVLRAVSLMEEICGGKVSAGLVDTYVRKFEPRMVSFRPDKCREVLGASVPDDKIAGIFRSLGFTVIEGKVWQVTVPTFRSDVSTEIDLCEEVGRMIGWAAIPDAIGNRGPLFAPPHPQEQFERQIRAILTGSGFDEILGHGLADSKLATLLHPDAPQVRISNPISDDLTIMRNSLVASALGIVSHNISQRQVDLALFEIGSAYLPGPANGVFIEDDRLVLVITGNRPGNWLDKPRLLGFPDLTGALENLRQHFHWPAFGYAPKSVPFLTAGSAFDISSGSQMVGQIGQVKPELARRFGIKADVFLAELRLEPLIALATSRKTFEPLPIFPAVYRDLAAVIDERTPIGDLVNTVRTAGGELLEAVEVFDVYSGRQIDQGRKSVALSLVFRRADRSLTGEEVDTVVAGITGRLKESLKAEIRDK